MIVRLSLSWENEYCEPVSMVNDVLEEKGLNHQMMLEGLTGGEALSTTKERVMVLVTIPRMLPPKGERRDGGTKYDQNGLYNEGC